MAVDKNVQYKTEADKPMYIGEVTDAQIAKWKKEYPDGIYGVPLKKSNRIVYFRNPDLDALNCAYAKTDWNKQLDKWVELARVTFLGGDEEVLTNDRLFTSVVGRLQEAAQGEETEMVNL
jgi:hypothetical protein